MSREAIEASDLLQYIIMILYCIDYITEYIDFIILYRTIVSIVYKSIKYYEFMNNCAADFTFR